jgi:hypothetical protein
VTEIIHAPGWDPNPEPKPVQRIILPIPRAPLGPLPGGAYVRELPFARPDRDLYFYRGQFCGLRVPGAPVVPGANDRNPECVMACLLDHYPREIQDQFLQL